MTQFRNTWFRLSLWFNSKPLNILAFRYLSTSKIMFQRSINKTCCSSEDKFITEDTMAKVLQFIQKDCLHINKFVYARSRKCERKIGIGN